MSTPDPTGRQRRWWVFDRPIARDPLFAAGVALGVLGIVATIVNPPAGAAGFVFNVLSAIPMGVLFVGTVGGSVREFARARRA